MVFVGLWWKKLSGLYYPMSPYIFKMVGYNLKEIWLLLLIDWMTSYWLENVVLCNDKSIWNQNCLCLLFDICFGNHVTEMNVSLSIFLHSVIRICQFFSRWAIFTEVIDVSNLIQNDSIIYIIWKSWSLICIF